MVSGDPALATPGDAGALGVVAGDA